MPSLVLTRNLFIVLPLYLPNGIARSMAPTSSMQGSTLAGFQPCWMLYAFSFSAAHYHMSSLLRQEATHPHSDTAAGMHSLDKLFLELDCCLGVMTLQHVRLTLTDSNRLVSCQVQIKHHRSIRQQHHFNFRNLNSSHGFILQQERL